MGVMEDTVEMVETVETVEQFKYVYILIVPICRITLRSYKMEVKKVRQEKPEKRVNQEKR
jgi:hypothetical protein